MQGLGILYCRFGFAIATTCILTVNMVAGFAYW